MKAKLTTLLAASAVALTAFATSAAARDQIQIVGSSTVFPFLGDSSQLKGISLDTLTYSAIENTNITDAYERAMKTRYVQHPHLLTIIDPQQIFLQRIIGEGTILRALCSTEANLP